MKDENVEEIQQNNVHMGQNVRKFRQLKGMKQIALGQMIGMNQQQAISRLENQRVIKVETLEKIAPILGVSVDILRTLPEENGNIIIENNTFSDNDKVEIGTDFDKENTYNYEPIDKALAFFKEHLAEERKQKQELMDRIKELEDLIRRGMK